MTPALLPIDLGLCGPFHLFADGMTAARGHDAFEYHLRAQADSGVYFVVCSRCAGEDVCRLYADETGCAADGLREAVLACASGLIAAHAWEPAATYFAPPLFAE